MSCVIALSSLLAACDDEATTPDPISTPATATDEGGSDAEAQADAATTEDSTTVPDSEAAGPEITDPEPPIQCTYNGLAQGIVEAGTWSPDHFQFIVVSKLGAPMNTLYMHLLSGGAAGPGTYDLAKPYDECDNCLIANLNCQDVFTCEKQFYADEGTLIIESWDDADRFTGRLEGVVMKEMYNAADGKRVPLPGGETWCLDDWSFDKLLPGSDKVAAMPEAQETCVAEGSGIYKGANVADFSLPNCYGDMVNLHSAGCGNGTKALRLFSTAGWCGACTVQMGVMVDEHGGGMLTREAIRTQTPGLDLFFILGENNSGKKPTLEYCLEYANSKNVDPAMVLVDFADSDAEIPLLSPDGQVKYVRTLATTWSNINPHLVESPYGSVSTYFPWEALLDARNMEYAWSDFVSAGTFAATLESLLSE